MKRGGAAYKSICRLVKPSSIEMINFLNTAATATEKMHNAEGGKKKKKASRHCRGYFELSIFRFVEVSLFFLGLILCVQLEPVKIHTENA